MLCKDLCKKEILHGSNIPLQGDLLKTGRCADNFEFKRAVLRDVT
jgi:hypothetical protein